MNIITNIINFQTRARKTARHLLDEVRNVACLKPQGHRVVEPAELRLHERAGIPELCGDHMGMRAGLSCVELC